MTIRDCYRLSLHTIKANRSRSILTVVITTFMSALIMGMMSLAISFYKNSNDIINQAYFHDNSVVTIEYKNVKNDRAVGQKLFTSEYYDSYVSTLDQYSDVVQTVRYSTNIVSPFGFTDPSYPTNIAIEIVEGRNIAKSEKKNEVIVHKSYYQKSLDGEDPLTIGSTHTTTFTYPVKVMARRSYTEQYTFDVEYVVVGVFDYVDGQKVILNGQESYIEYQNIIGDIGLAINNNESIYITSSTVYHRVGGQLSNAEATVKRLSALTTAINETLPPALDLEIFADASGVEYIYHYYDGASCDVYNKFNENDAIRSIVIAASVLISVVLLLMAIGSLANSVSISMNRNKRFIGLLKVLGMHGKSIVTVVIFESITLISIGVLLGYLLLFALFSPLTNLINMIIGFTFNAYMKVTSFVAGFSLPVYVFFVALVVFLLLTYLFSRTALHRVAKGSPIKAITEVS